MVARRTREWAVTRVKQMGWRVLAAAVAVLALLAGPAGAAAAERFKFGVMSDTQRKATARG